MGFGGLENLEQRALFAITLPGSVVTMPTTTTSTPVITTLPTTGGTTSSDAGNTVGTASAVVVGAMGRTTRSDSLPSSSDLDYFKVTLNQGDFLAVDIDATSTGLSSTLAVVNGNDVAQQVTMIGTEPETGVAGADPALGFWAPASGEYYVKVGSTASTIGRSRTYNLNLQRIGMSYSAQNDALAQDGAFHAWMNKEGTALNFAGPKGYGFSLRGSWTPTSTRTGFNFSTTSTMYLSTPFLSSTIGEIALTPASGGFTVATKSFSGWRPLGELVSTSGQFGFSLAPIAGQVKQAIGLDVSSLGVMNKWTIMTGEKVRENFAAMKIEQVLDGVPYLVYGGGDVGRVAAHFGDITITQGQLNSTIMIAEPADPYLYVHYDMYAMGASMKGRIPFNNQVGPNTISPEIGNSQQRGEQYYGHAFAHADIPVAELPITLHGNITVDLDANNDGVLLGNALKGGDLFRADAPWTAMAHDINLGVEGYGTVGYELGSYAISAQVGEASLVYDGPKQGVWFKGTSHTPDLWSDTPAKSFKTDAQSSTELYGYIYMDGRLSVSAESSYTVDVLGSTVLDADATVNVTSQGTIASTVFGASGSLHTPIGEASVNGTFYTNGNFLMEGNVNVDIGDNRNYLRGNADVSFAKTGSTYSFHADGELHVQARLSLGSEFRVKGSADGWIDLIYGWNGLQYDVGMNYDVAYEVYDGVWSHDWIPAGPSQQGGFELNNDELIIKVGSKDFSISLS
jgi:hypothetical protein